MDYQQLALSYVLSESPEEQVQVASAASAKLKHAPSDIKDWILSVSRWLSPEDGDDGHSNIIAYARAIEFLSSTLEQLDKSKPIFREAQVKLLVTFFCNILQNQHGGFLPSCRALASLVRMPSFPAEKAIEVLDGLGKVGDYFREQPASTRLEVYRLLQTVLSSDTIKAGLKSQSSEPGAFMAGILETCRNERDPACLMVWFGVLQTYITSCVPAVLYIEQAFSVFSSYFPISVRASQTPEGIKGEDLKEALRGCFAAQDDVARLAIPFLVGKMDQGEGLSLSVRTDILKTMDACLNRYENASSISPFADKLWTSLKYEVRNGDEPETAQLALQVIRTLTRRLEGGDLSNFLASVASDCHEDLTSPQYASPAGKLITVVMSAQTPAFLGLATKTIGFLKRQLQGSTAAVHVRDLLVALNSVLELRPLMMGGEDSDHDLAADHLSALLKETYEPVIERRSKPALAEESKDDREVQCRAFRGLGLLVIQPSSASGVGFQTLLSEDVCRGISTRLSTVIIDNCLDPGLDSVVDEAASALARINSVYPDAAAVFVQVCFKDTPAAGAIISRIAPILVHIATQHSPVIGTYVDRFVYVSTVLMQMLHDHLAGDSRSFEVPVQLALALLNAMTQFKAKFLPAGYRAVLPSSGSDDDVVRRYPELERWRAEAGTLPDETTEVSRSDIDTMFFSLCFFLMRQLIRRATAVQVDRATGNSRLELSSDFDDIHDDITDKSRYLVIVSRIARFTIRNLDPKCQEVLNLPAQIFSLFKSVSGSQNSNPGRVTTWDLIIPQTESEAACHISQFSLGIAEGISPTAVVTLTDPEPPHITFLNGLLSGKYSNAARSPLIEALLANLANKVPAEDNGTLVDVMKSLAERVMTESGANTNGQSDEERVTSAGILALMTGAIMRRAKGGAMNAIITSLSSFLQHPRIGHELARRLERVSAPILEEEHSVALILPTWKSKIYFQLVRPLLEKALPQPGYEDEKLLVCSNHRIAVISLLRWLAFPIYEGDVEAILRISLCLAQDLPGGREVAAALSTIRTIIREDHNAAKGHLRTIIRVCLRTIDVEVSDRPTWMPKDYVQAQALQAHVSQCQLIASSILTLIPDKYDRSDPQTRTASASVNRLLMKASGLGKRAMRENVRVARNVWRNIKT